MAAITSDERRIVGAAIGGSVFEGTGGVAAIVLGAIGLFGIIPGVLAAITTIVVGAAFLGVGVPLMAGYKELAERLPGGRSGRASASTGMSAGLAAGVAGVTLGILALLGVAPVTLMASAVIVFGAALMINSISIPELNKLEVSAVRDEKLQRSSSNSAKTAAGLQVLLGIAAGTLGILALIGYVPMILILCGLIVVGAAELVTGAALSGRMSAKLKA